MRIVLIGAPSDRARLRRALAGTGLTVVSEADSMEAARSSAASADAYLTAAGRGDATGSDGGRADRTDGAVESPHPEAVEATVPAEALTPREMQVLDLLAEGLPNKAIARRLDISDQTVKFHVAQVCGKLGAINRTDAVRRAVRRGLIAL